MNGKAVHGTGGVNYLPHMLAFLSVLPQPYLAQVTMTRQFQQALYEYCVRACACAAIADDREPFKEKITSTVSVHSESGPKGSGGPKAGFRREVSFALD